MGKPSDNNKILDNMAARENSLRLLLEMIEPTRHEIVNKTQEEEKEQEQQHHHHHQQQEQEKRAQTSSSSSSKKRDLQDECDNLLRLRKHLVTRNIGLWTQLTTTSSASGTYNWALRTLDENERQIKDIDSRLQRIKMIEEQEKGSV